MDFSGLLLVQLSDPTGSLLSKIPFSLPSHPPNSPTHPSILNFSLSATLFPKSNTSPQVFSVLDKATAVLSPQEWAELRGNGVLKQGKLYEGSFYLYYRDTWEPLQLESVFIDPVIDTYYYQIHANSPDFVFLQLSASFLTTFSAYNPVSIAPGTDIVVISSPFGMLGPDIYHNSVNKGVISLVLEEQIAVVETRMLPGTAGGTVLSSDLSTVLGILVPGMGEINVFALMYPLFRWELAGKSGIWQGISKVACIKSGHMTGSGVLFATNLILTNRHVVGDSIDVEVRLEGCRYTGKVTSVGKILDVAWVEVADIHSFPIEQATDLRPGERVYAIGYGNLLTSVSPMVTSGTLSKLIYHDSSLIALQTSTYTLDGQSGGALVNSQGQFLGLVTSTVKMADKPLRTLGLCISLEAVKTRELWESQEKWLREIFEYQNVDFLPRYRGKL